MTRATVVTAFGALVIAAACVLTWVNVDIDTERVAGLADDAVEAVDNDLLDQAADTVETIDRFVPDWLVEASVEGQNAFELFGVAVYLIGLAAVIVVLAWFWSARQRRAMRWVALVLATVLFVSIAALIATTALADSALGWVLPESWEPYSPSFDLTTAPVIALIGSAIMFVGLLGRTPGRPVPTPPAGPVMSVPPHTPNIPQPPLPPQPPVPPRPQPPLPPQPPVPQPPLRP